MVLQFRGMNSSEPTDWRHFRPTKNELHFARIFWESSDATFVVAPRLTDEDPATGLPRSIPGGRFARTTLGTGTREVGGQWVLAWEGDGECGVRNGANNLRGVGRYIEFARDTSAPVDVCIYSTSGTTPVRNLWLGEQRYYATRDQDRIKPDWVSMLDGLGVDVLRSMQLQNINSSTVQSWADERPATYFTASMIVADDTVLGRGAHLSLLLTMCVEAGKDLWLCVPHRVDEGQTYVQWVHEALRFIRDWRHPFRGVAFLGRIFLQFSNETWNTQFAANAYCRARGVALGVDGSNEYEQGHQFYAIRSEQVFETAIAARQTLGLPNQILRVLDEQAGAGEYAFRFRTQVNPTHASPRNVAADMLATGAYYGHTDYQRGDFLTVTGQVGTFTANEVVTNGLSGAAERRGTYRFSPSGTNHFVEININPFWSSFEPGDLIGLTSGATATVTSVEANRIGRVTIGDSAFNGWLTADAFTALTDTQLGALMQRDMDQRVFRAVTAYNDPTFPSAPLIRNGGILATMQYANVSRGLQVVIYEGGCDHINLPAASEDAARWGAAHARNLAWHHTTVAGNLHEQSITRHIDAGVEGFTIFDEGTQWSGIHGCWSVYDDYRTGFANQQRYLATQRAFAGGVPQIFAQYPPSVVVVRARGSTASISSPPPITATSARTRTVTSATPSAGTLSTLLNSTSARTRTVVRATGSSVELRNAPPMEPLSARARVRVIATGSSATVAAPAIAATSGTARFYSCLVPSDATIRNGFDGRANSGNGTVRTRVLSSLAGLKGADGVAVSPVNRFMRPAAGHRGIRLFVPAGTNVWRGQALGWFGDTTLVRPLRPGDMFAGLAAENVSGYTVDNSGDQVLRRDLGSVMVVQRGTITQRIDGTQLVTPGVDVFALDDKTLTLADTGSRIGRVLSSRFRFATVYFEGTQLRVNDEVAT